MSSQTELNRLIDSLLGETFAREQNFETLTTNEIGEILFGTKEELESAHETAAPDAQSFQRCSETYCLLLQHLELDASLNQANQTLGDLRHREQKTQLISSTALAEPSPKDGMTTPAEPLAFAPEAQALEAPLSTEDWPRLGESEKNSADVANFFSGEDKEEEGVAFDLDGDDIAPLHETATPHEQNHDINLFTPEPLDGSSSLQAPGEVLLHASDFDVPLFDSSPTEASSKPNEHFDHTPIADSEGPAKASWFDTKAEDASSPIDEGSFFDKSELEPLPKQATLPVGVDSLTHMNENENENEPSHTEVKHASEEPAHHPPHLPPPPPRKLIEENAEVDLLAQVNSHPEEVSHHEFPSGPATTKLAKQYWQLAHFFRFLSLDQKFPLPPPHLDKLIAQSYCSALEAELGIQFKSILEKFWPHKERAIKSVIDDKAHHFSLHPALKSGLTEISVDHSEWLWEKRFPESPVLNSLRYLMATREFSKLKPTLMDLGVMLLLFGQDDILGAFPLTNFLGTEGFTKEQLYETSFRLFRLQILGAKAVGVGPDFSAAHLGLIENDVEQVFQLIKQITKAANSSNEVEQVA